MFIEQEGSREEDNGEFKVSYHFISNLLTTSQTYPNVYATILNWIQHRCPLVMSKIKDDKAVITEAEAKHMGRWLPLVGMDSHAKSCLQGLAVPWGKKKLSQKAIMVVKVRFVYIFIDTVLRGQSAFQHYTN